MRKRARAVAAVRRDVTKALLCLAALLAFARAASAEPVQTIVNNGDPANRVDIVVLGDGYTAAEMSKYASDVQRFVQSMFEQEPFREYQRFFNVHRIDVQSTQSGADHPENGVFRNTAFDSAYNCTGIQRLICANTSKAMSVASNSLAPAQIDLVILIVNDSVYGGSGGAVAIASTNAAAVELVLHESGHTFGGLADEYSTSPPACNNSVEPVQANATRETSRAAVKWGAWIDPSTPVPTETTANGIPGVYLGARYCTEGLYRPTYNSKMRSLGQPYEQVNTEQLVRRIYNRVSPVDAASPAASSVSLNASQSQTFGVTTPSPLTHALAVNWSVDGQPAGSSASFTVAPGSLAAGTHTVEATVSDQTAFVRSDPERLLSESLRWTVTVASSNPIDDPTFFVTQHYRDFLGREPDASGLNFWVGQMTNCGNPNLEVCRVNVSAAFFQSIEFQNTGYLVERIYKAAYGDATEASTGLVVPVIRRSEFVADTPLISQNVVVGVGDWPTTLENNKTAYAQAFVQRARFTSAFAGMDATQFVDRLNGNAGGVLTADERAALINEASAGTVAARASVLRKVAENAELDRREKSRAFVLMEYYGYLRRNPDDAPEAGLNFAGWNFWLGKLNEAGGNYVRAEMVNSFLKSIEYRARFGTP